MKRLPVPLCTLAAVLLATPAVGAPDAAATIALAASVLRVEAPRPGGGYALGSAVTVGRETVVTNCHVTRDARVVNIVRGGVRWTASAQASDLDHDLCLLRVPGLQSPAVEVGRAADLHLGQPVTALGYTGGLGLQNSAGEVVELHRYDGSRVIQSSNWFSSGASGGGLFDDQGQLVGVLTFRLRGGEAHYFAAPAEWVRQLVDAAEHGRYRDVMPLSSEPAPYWQTAMQPRFLRAAQLQQSDRWSELAAMAAEWSRADPDDSEPWFLLGSALQRLGRTPEARRALECSLALEPARSAARVTLAGLATVVATSGRPPCLPERS